MSNSWRGLFGFTSDTTLARKLLGLAAHGALTEQEVKAAFARKLKALHPDRGGPDGADSVVDALKDARKELLAEIEDEERDRRESDTARRRAEERKSAPQRITELARELRQRRRDALRPARRRLDAAVKVYNQERQQVLADFEAQMLKDLRGKYPAPSDHRLPDVLREALTRVLREREALEYEARGRYPEQ